MKNKLVGAIVLGVASGVGVAVVLTALCLWYGVHLNTTASLPLGL